MLAYSCNSIHFSKAMRLSEKESGPSENARELEASERGRSPMMLCNSSASRMINIQGL